MIFTLAINFKGTLYAVLWCGASAWHRPAPRGEKSHRPAPTPQAGAKISSPRPNAPSAPGRPNAPGRKKCSGALKRPGAQKNAPVLNINTYFILKNKRKKEQLKNNRFIFSIKQQPRLYIAFIILIIARLKNE